MAIGGFVPGSMHLTGCSLKCFGGKWRYVALLSLGKRQKTDKNSGGKRRCSKKREGGVRAEVQGVVVNGGLVLAQQR